MSIDVTFNGNTYPIPEDGDVNWEDLTDYLVALSAAATATSIKFSARTATTTPQTLQSTDAFLYMNVASASIVNLPAGILGQLYIVVDISGLAGTNNITLTPNGAETINGLASYIIATNNGAVFIQFDGTAWRVASEINSVLNLPIKRRNNSTNASYIDGSITALSAFASSSDGTSSSASYTGSNAIEIVIALDSGECLKLATSYAESGISALSDISNIFLTSDSGTGIYVSKSSSSATVTVKNRMGSTKLIEIKSLTNIQSSVTAWS